MTIIGVRFDCNSPLGTVYLHCEDQKFAPSLHLTDKDTEFLLDGMKVTGVSLLPAMLNNRLSVTITDQTHAEFVTL